MFCSLSMWKTKIFANTAHHKLTDSIPRQLATLFILNILKNYRHSYGGGVKMDCVCCMQHDHFANSSHFGFCGHGFCCYYRSAWLSIGYRLPHMTNLHIAYSAVLGHIIFVIIRLLFWMGTDPDQMWETKIQLFTPEDNLAKKTIATVKKSGLRWPDSEGGNRTQNRANRVRVRG